MKYPYLPYLNTENLLSAEKWFLNTTPKTEIKIQKTNINLIELTRVYDVATYINISPELHANLVFSTIVNNCIQYVKIPFTCGQTFIPLCLLPYNQIFIELVGNPEKLKDAIVDISGTILTSSDARLMTYLFNPYNNDIIKSSI